MCTDYIVCCLPVPITNVGLVIAVERWSERDGCSYVQTRVSRYAVGLYPVSLYSAGDILLFWVLATSILGALLVWVLSASPVILATSILSICALSASAVVCALSASSVSLGSVS